jgi:hypothetical protein
MAEQRGQGRPGGGGWIGVEAEQKLRSKGGKKSGITKQGQKGEFGNEKLRKESVQRGAAEASMLSGFVGASS